MHSTCISIRAWALIAFLASLGIVNLAQSPDATLNEAKQALSSQAFTTALSKANASLNFTNATRLPDLTLIPVTGRWDFELAKNRTALVGAIHTTKGTTFAPAGTYLIQARVDNEQVRWFPMRADGTTFGTGAPVTVERATPETAAPRAEVVITPQRRCCYYVDSVRHCTECD